MKFTLVYHRHMREHSREFDSVDAAVRWAFAQEDLGAIATDYVMNARGEIALGREGVHWAFKELSS